MQITIKLFGPEARAVGSSQLSLQVEKLPIVCGELRRQIAKIEPRLAKSLVTARFAVNSDFVSDQAMIGAQDEVAIIGSVCGG